MRASKRIAALEEEFRQFRNTVAGHSTTEAVEVAHAAAQTAHSVALDARDQIRDVRARLDGVQEGIAAIVAKDVKPEAEDQAGPDAQAEPVKPPTPIRAPRARKSS